MEGQGFDQGRRKLLKAGAGFGLILLFPNFPADYPEPPPTTSTLQDIRNIDRDIVRSRFPDQAFMSQSEQLTKIVGRFYARESHQPEDKLAPVNYLWHQDYRRLLAERFPCVQNPQTIFGFADFDRSEIYFNASVFLYSNIINRTVGPEPAMMACSGLLHEFGHTPPPIRRFEPITRRDPTNNQTYLYDKAKGAGLLPALEQPEGTAQRCIHNLGGVIEEMIVQDKALWFLWNMGVNRDPLRVYEPQIWKYRNEVLPLLRPGGRENLIALQADSQPIPICRLFGNAFFNNQLVNLPEEEEIQGRKRVLEILTV